MIGNKFGKWTVLSYYADKKPGKHYECICECGNIRIKGGTELRAGRGMQCTDCQYQKLYDPTKEIGNKYGKWTIIRFVDIHRKLMRYEAECECGQRTLHCVADLRSGKSKQCTICHNRENAKNNIKHNMHSTPTYFIWQAMIQRCTNPNSTGFSYYGGRGIEVCERWRKFENFLDDMGQKPEGLTLDRINNDGNYEPGNCRWITHKENCNNRRPYVRKNPQKKNYSAKD